MDTKERRDLWGAHVFVERLTEPYRLHWLSFCDPQRPKGKQFLGVVIVWAYGFVDAADKAHRMGINPGGEVAGMEYELGEFLAGPEWWNRLLDATEVDRCEADRVRRYEEHCSAGQMQ